MSFMNCELHILAGEHGWLYPGQAINVETAQLPLSTLPGPPNEQEATPSDLNSSQENPTDIKDAVRTAMSAVTINQMEQDDNTGFAMRTINSLLSYFEPSTSFLGSYMVRAICKYIDTIVDGILRIARAALASSGKDIVAIPEVFREYSALFGYITACYKVEGGYFRDLASIHRRSHILVEPRDNGELYAEGCFGLDEMELGFSEYLCKFMWIGPRGSFRSLVGENSLRIAFTLSSRRSYWNPYIERVCFEQFSKVTYNITGFWFLNTIIESVLEFLTPKIWGAYVRTLESSIENTLRDALDEQLVEVPIIDP